MTDTPTPFLAMLTRLRRSFLQSSIVAVAGISVAYLTYTRWVGVFVWPLQRGNAHMSFILTTIFDGFLIRLKLSVWVGLSLTIPFYMYQCLKAIFPRLSSSVKKAIMASLLGSFCLACFSFYMTYFRLIPLSVSVLTGTDFIPSSIKLMLHFDQNAQYVAKFLLISMLTFQFPVVLEILLYLNILKRKKLLSMWRFVIVLIVIVSAIVTPTPDVVNQLAIAIPMGILYVGTLLIAKVFGFGEG